MRVDLSDQDLMAKIASGDRLAMQQIYNQHSQAVTHFVKNWLSDPFEASDIMHETMMEIWRSANKFAGRSSVKTWIFSIARNKAIDRNRKAARTVLQDIDVDIIDDTPNPEHITQSFQDAKRVRACIEQLSPAHRSVIHLAFFEDLGYREIADIENVPVGTVKTRIMHAKKLLLRLLDDDNQD